ncbi:Acetyltransferase GNAT family [Staphylococcus aureus]|nr:Acetyltransferase GNAT family [Staphylococcus aureus]
MAHIIRRVSIKDVENFISMLANIYDESPYMFYTPGEYDPSVTSASKQIKNISLLRIKSSSLLKVMNNSLALPLLIRHHFNALNMLLKLI